VAVIKKDPQLQPKPSSQPDAWQEAERYGFDMSLIEANLRKTPLERIRAHDRALSLAMTLRKAMTAKKKERHG
jgi:hypothetical protein